jgi:hypothetical protein
MHAEIGKIDTNYSPYDVEMQMMLKCMQTTNSSVELI